MELGLMSVAILLGLLALGTPAAWAMGIAGCVTIYLSTDSFTVVEGVLETSPYEVGSGYIFTAVPMFILMAFLLSAGGVSDRLYEAVSIWTGHRRGGMAVATVGASGVLGAMAGTSLAAASVMSRVAMPSMRSRGYSVPLAAGTIGAGSTLSMLIPPSIILIIFGLSTGTSIGDLLIAGLVPGVVLGVFFSATAIMWALVRPDDAPRAERRPWGERFRSIPQTLPSAVLIAVITGSLYFGLATPTEVASIGATLSIVMGLALRRLTLKGFNQAVVDALTTSVMIFSILAGAAVFSLGLTLSDLPAEVVTALGEAGLGKWTSLVVISLVYVVGAMFIDELPLLLITLPISFPLVTGLGFDPVWFGIYSVLLIGIGMLAPPVGIVSFVVSAAANVRLSAVYLGASIYLIPFVALLVLITVFPELVLWLPSTVR